MNTVPRGFTAGDGLSEGSHYRRARTLGDSHGVATLLREHVEVRRGELRFCFPAKSGVERVAVIRDPDLGRLVAALRRGRAPADRLFAYRVGSERREVRAAEVNDRFRDLAGNGFTVKDMRTWTATVLAAAEFAAQDSPKSKTATRRVESQVMRAVSEQLGNTPAVCRRSYVDPRVLELFQEGRTIEATLRKLATQDLENPQVREQLERAVLRLLRSS